ncbi:putative Retrovirus-related Pol polyprotein [Hypsibius exemplaris]|uniref:Retrovirus-related Pol polyprotein n=1 Tax=Hypsibius exemplaris TaxID=2072580 RepID=A0A9X6NJG7_HYPEX|nr:putative Retrovirus-related Pol polyprotein [Hypsibius exemplaris]
MDSGRVLACPTFRPPLPRLRAEELAALEKEVGVAETTRLPGRLSNNQHINNQHINNQRFHDGDGSPGRVDATATVTVPVDLRKIEATVACGGTDRVTVAEDLTDQSLTVGRDGSAGPSGEMESIVTDTRDQPRADGSDVSGTPPDNGEAVINDATLAGDGRTQPPTTRGTILYPDRAAEAATDDGEDLPIWCPSAKKFDRMSPIDEPEVAWDEIEVGPKCSPEQKTSYIEMLQRRGKVFPTPSAPIGCTSLITHKIDTLDHRPVSQPLRRKAHWQKEEIRKQEVEMLAMKAIRPCLGSDWCSNVVLARKKDGTLRFAVDYGDVNQRTVKDQYPLARIDECLDAMKGCSWFTQIDLCSGYWQVKMDEASIAKTAFRTPDGFYEFLVMPFGLCNSPATFCRLMEEVLGDLKWKTCAVYLDDIQIFSKTFDEHVEHVEEVLRRLENSGLKIKPSKCFYARPQVDFLGHTVDSRGISVNQNKVMAVLMSPRPKDAAAVRSFVGTVMYYSKYLPALATVAHPLIKMSRKGETYE